MADITDTLQEKAGPFPVWVWGAAIGLVMVAVIWWQGRDTSGDDGSTSSGDDGSAIESAADTVADLSDVIDGSFRPGTANGSSYALDTVETVDTNTAWRMRAIAYLIGQGNAPLTASAAIDNYMDGKTLTTAQTALVNAAISGIGQPPTAVTAPATTTSTAYKRYYRDRKGQVYGVAADGTATAISDEKYISLGLPKLNPDAAAYKYHTAASNETSLGDIAAKYKTTSNHIIALNGWKSGVRITKGKKVKVPA